MLKSGILNPQLASLLASTGHNDLVVVSDAGLPMPLGVERIDLAWKPNEPGYLDVLEEILKYMVIDRAIFAEELKTVSPEMHRKILKILPEGLKIDYIPHIQFKEKTKLARGIIRTGEFTPYPSIILVAGCAY
jgi:D-ribose pyranase